MFQNTRPVATSLIRLMRARYVSLLPPALAVLLAGVACHDDTAGRHAPAIAAAPAQAAPQRPPAAPALAPDDTQQTIRTGPLCASDDEDAALRCAEGAARRSNDSLTIQATSGPLVLVNTEGGESEELRAQYKYAGTLRARRVLHLVQASGYESTAMTVYGSAGATPVTLASLPIPAPGGPYFAAAEQGMSVCEGPQSTIEIWRLADSSVVREWHVEPWDCGRDAGWGPESVAWVSADTLGFTHVEPATDSLARAQGVQERHRGLVVRKAGRWSLVDPAP